MLTVFAAFAELERGAIRERQAEGIALAKAAGKHRKARNLTSEEIAARLRIEVGAEGAGSVRPRREPPDPLFGTGGQG